MDSILDFCLSIALTAIGIILGFAFGKLKEKHAKINEEELAIRNGIQSLLREQIIEICDHCLDRGYLHIHSLESLEDLERHYKALGGNGAVEKLLSDVRKLEVK